ncbi:MAG: NifU family protein [Ichthyobacteriaceae bacterium]|nr:NifU family protein [Ichthyobacteriaceae bacterium]
MTAEEIEANVLKALSEIRPFLQRDGGDVSFVSVEDNEKVNVKLEGACQGCNKSTITLKLGVEATIKRYVPSIKTVIDVGAEVEESI